MLRRTLWTPNSVRDFSTPYMSQSHSNNMRIYRAKDQDSLGRIECGFLRSNTLFYAY